MIETIEKLLPCFFISPIGSEDSDLRRKADKTLKHLVRPALESCGFLVQRADEIDDPGIITSQVIQRVLGDPIVVIDLTGHNANVFYELALRHATGKPFVQIAEKGERIPFDITNQRTVFYELDLDTIAEAKTDLVNKVNAAMRSTTSIETPVGRAIHLGAMATSDDDNTKALAEVLQRLDRIERAVAIPPDFMLDVVACDVANELLRLHPDPTTRPRFSFGLLESFAARHLGKHGSWKYSQVGEVVRQVEEMMNEKQATSSLRISNKTQVGGTARK